MNKHKTPAGYVRDIDPDARRLWEATSSDTGNHVTCYSAGEATLLLIEYPDGNGWEIYTPPSLRNNIGATIQGARQTLGLERDEIGGEVIGLAI